MNKPMIDLNVSKYVNTEQLEKKDILHLAKTVGVFGLNETNFYNFDYNVNGRIVKSEDLKTC